MSAAPAILSLREVTKSFGATRALDGVTLDLHPGEIHALVGENGAGKSTLMNVIAGALRPDGGGLTLAGQPVAFRDAAEARAAGIALIHQELSLFPQLTVTENIVMGSESRRGGLFDRAANRARVEKILTRFPHPDITPDRRVGDLPVAAQQVVEICRALCGNPRVLLMDEPTSSLERRDVDRLFELARGLAAEGMAVVYISHFLEEVRALCHRFTVLRDGRSVGGGRVAEAADHDIVAMMVGRDVAELFPARGTVAPGEVLLDVREVALAPRVARAGFAVRSGEIFGIAGIVGAGRSELMRSLAGLSPHEAGTITLRGHTLAPTESPAQRIAAGIGYLSEDRKREGLALLLSVADNLTLSRLGGLARHGVLDLPRQRTETAREITRLSVRTSGPHERIAALSGGNQQKIALGRLFFQDADVLLLDEPTRGVDIGSKVHLYEAINAAARAGKAVVVVSSYLPELFGLCDRLAVMSRGVLSEARVISEWTPEEVMRVATGVQERAA